MYPSFAGADTTAIAISTVPYHLMRNPTVYKQLTAEVDAAMMGGKRSMPVAYAEAVKLPCLKACINEGLKACINEGMRLHPSVGLTMPRLIPIGGATISGFHFPEGYRVGVNPAVVQYDKDVFGADADEYNPDRWLKGDAARMDKTMVVFGAGPRTCIGKNVSAGLAHRVDLEHVRLRVVQISLSEIYKLVPQIIHDFHIRLEDSSRAWKTHNYWFNKQTDIKIRIEERTSSH